MTPVFSMTGFGSAEGSVGNRRMRVEIKTVNHRFLDVKLRLPRDFSSLEIPLKASLQAKFSRGALDFKLEYADHSNSSATALQLDLELARKYHEGLLNLQKHLGLTDEIRTKDIAAYPNVITAPSSEMDSQQAWTLAEPLVNRAVENLLAMRAHEGLALCQTFEKALLDLEESLGYLRQRRVECEAILREKISEKIKRVFEAHPLANISVQGVLDSRIAQELSLAVEKSDVEEELIRFKGHLDHFRTTLRLGGSVGRKLDFIIQELGREINTLGNKAQDLGISEQVVQVKVRLEQIREQVMNLE